MTQGLIKDQSLYEKAYDVIKSKILSSEFPAGFRLQEEFLIKLLGVSKTPIKLALAKLEQEGLVNNIPRKGMYVIELTHEMVIEVYTLREVLEGLAARLAAKNISGKNIEKLRNILSQFIPNLEKMSLEAYLELDERFHEVIINASRHHRLQQFLNHLYDIIRLFKLKAANLPGRRKKAYKEHHEIFEALEKREPFKAEETMRHHIQKVVEELIVSAR